MDSVDAASQDKRMAYWNDVLAQLDRIDPKTLSDVERVNYEVYHEQIFNLAAAQRFRQWEMPFNSDSAFWSDIGYVMHGDDLRTREDYRNYIARMKQIPAWMDQEIANMKLGLARGFTVPREVLNGRDVSIAAVADLKKPEDSDLYKPFLSMPKTMPAADAEALRAEARKVIAQGVIPAYESCCVSSAKTTCPRRGRRWPPNRCPTARTITASRSANTPRSIFRRTRSTPSACA